MVPGGGGRGGGGGSRGFSVPGGSPPPAVVYGSYPLVYGSSPEELYGSEFGPPGYPGVPGVVYMPFSDADVEYVDVYALGAEYSGSDYYGLEEKVYLEGLEASGEKASSATIRVMQYNVLADCYAKTAKFDYVNPKYLKWEYRFPCLMKQILSIDPDVVCLQEVEQNHFYEMMLPHLESKGGFKGIFKKRPSSMKTDGCAILWRDSHFKLLNKTAINFNPPEGEISEKSKSSKGKKIKTNNIALCAYLLDRRTGSKIWVISTHLFWDPAAPEVKLSQAQMLLSFVTNLVKNEEGSLIVCGDFNSTPDSDVYRLMSSSALSSAFEKSEPDYTNYTLDFKGCLDYVLYSSADFYPTNLCPFPTESELSSEIALPNAVHPSDHLPLYCDLILCSAKGSKADASESDGEVVSCAFGIHCRRVDCKYSHPPLCRYGMKCAHRFDGSCTRVHVVPCRYGLDCRSVNCEFCHIPCKFGRYCSNPTCVYSHYKT